MKGSTAGGLAKQNAFLRFRFRYEPSQCGGRPTPISPPKRSITGESPPERSLRPGLPAQTSRGATSNWLQYLWPPSGTRVYLQMLLFYGVRLFGPHAVNFSKLSALLAAPP